MNIRFFQKKKVVELFLFTLIILVAFWARANDYLGWQLEPERHFYQGEPLLTTYDGYYYLTLARDMMEGTYDPVNKMRIVPDYPSRPFPPPLMSVIAAKLAKILPFSLNWIGVTLPIFLGLLLAIPLYAFGRYLNGSVMALTTTMIGLLSGSYVLRSGLGWFDTDCMNVTFTMAISYCFMRFALGKNIYRYCYLFSSAILASLFMWWWDQARMVPALISLIPFTIALVFFYRPGGKEAKIFYFFLAFLSALTLLWGGFDLPVKMLSSVWEHFLYISKHSAQDFPDIGIFISEQAKMSLAQLVEKSVANWVTFGVGCLGFVGLCYVRIREVSFLVVPLFLGICAYLFASRFAIFLTPILALGVGYSTSLIWNYFPNNKLVHLLIGVVLVYAVSDMDVKVPTREPSVFGEMVAGMAKIDELTPNNAVIWNWSNYGYPLIYWGRRATITDGAAHDGERVVYNALPLIVSDYRLSANFIRFYVKRGVAGINAFYMAFGNDKAKAFKLMQEILAAGPEKAKEILAAKKQGDILGEKSIEEWLEFFYPQQSRPIYLFLDWPLSNLLDTVYWFGTWDAGTRKGERLVTGVELAFGGRVDGHMLTTLSGVGADLERGVVEIGENKYELKSAVYSNKMGTQEYSYPGNVEGQLHLEINIDTNFSYVAYEDERLAQTIFSKLYWRTKVPPKKYFISVYKLKPYCQIWQVVGDVL